MPLAWDCKPAHPVAATDARGGNLHRRRCSWPDHLSGRSIESRATMSGSSSEWRSTWCSSRCWPSSATSASRSRGAASPSSKRLPSSDHVGTDRTTAAGTDAAHQHRAFATTATGRPRSGAADYRDTDGSRCAAVRHRHRRRHHRRSQPGDLRRRTRRCGCRIESSPSIYPQPGWVEHDADEIWAVAKSTLNAVVGRSVANRSPRSALPTSARPSSPGTGRPAEPYGTAIVWQDRRTADRCEALREGGCLALVRETTGLVLDPYFSASKFEWLLTERAIPIDDDLALGTIDSWLIWNLTGGAVHATDPTNASRTMLFDIRTPAVVVGSRATCSAFPCRRFRACCRPAAASASPPMPPDARPASRSRASPAISRRHCSVRRASRPGMAKNTYGTGSFVLLNVGSSCPPPTEGMLTTVAWTARRRDGCLRLRRRDLRDRCSGPVDARRLGLDRIGSRDRSAGSERRRQRRRLPGPGVRRSRAARGGIPMRGAPSSASPAARRRRTSPAPWSRRWPIRPATWSRPWLPPAAPRWLRCESTAAPSVMDMLLQMQADQLGVIVQRPTDQETTALGAAYLAGLAEGVWPSLAAINDRWEIDATFQPTTDRTLADLAHAGWLRAVSRSRAWIVSS